MTTYAFTSLPLARQYVRLITSTNPVGVDAHIVELLASLVTNDSGVPGVTVANALTYLLGLSAWDHVVRTVADLPPAPAGPYRDLTSGSWCFVAPIALGATKLRVPPGVSVLLKGMGWTKVLSSDVDYTLEVEGTAILEGMAILNANSGPILVNAAAAELFTEDCWLINDDDGTPDIQVLAAKTVQLKGGRLTGLPGIGTHGVLLSGTIGSVSLTDVVGDGLASLLCWAVGVTSSAQVLGCKAQSDCTKAIIWAAANMATQGLLVTGNAWGMAVPYTGFTAASARVNCKANSNNAGLLTETAIVP